MKELPKVYDPRDVESRIYKLWMDGDCFKAEPNPDKKPFSIVMPPPNVTGQLHMGHAMDCTLQDILIRYKRMQGYAALWVPGTDHAGCPDRAVNGLDVARVITRANQILNNQGGTDMSCALMIRNDDTGVVYYWSPETGRIGLGHPDQMKVLEDAGVKLINSSSKANWAGRADQISTYVQAKTTAYEKAQTAALETLAKSVGANPADITKAVTNAVNEALKNITVTLTNKGA